MFGHMKAQPVLATATCSIDQGIAALLAITENAQPTRWIEFSCLDSVVPIGSGRSGIGSFLRL